MKKYIICFAALLVLFVSCKKERENEPYQILSDQKGMKGDGYVGDQNCTSCHQEATKDWQGSHHDKAMQLVTENSVLGDFDNVSVSLDGVAYFFYKKESDFFVKTTELDGSEHEYKITYVFGLTPLCSANLLLKVRELQIHFVLQMWGHVLGEYLLYF